MLVYVQRRGVICGPYSFENSSSTAPIEVDSESLVSFQQPDRWIPTLTLLAFAETLRPVCSVGDKTEAPQSAGTSPEIQGTSLVLSQPHSHNDWTPPPFPGAGQRTAVRITTFDPESWPQQTKDAFGIALVIVRARTMLKAAKSTRESTEALTARIQAATAHLPD